MKRIILLLLMAALLISLCACGNDPQQPADEDVNIDDTPAVSVKDIIAAAQQSSGAKTADKLIGMGDSDFATLLTVFLGIDAQSLTDGAMAISTSTAANEIIVLKPADSGSVGTIKDALETHRNDTIMSDERYFPENVELMKQATIYENAGCVIMICDEMLAMVKNSVDQMFSAQDLVPDLAQQFYEAGMQAPEYNYNEPVPGNDVVGADWFSDAMFIGDSRMVGLLNYVRDNSLFTPGRDLTLVGLTVSNVYTEYVNVDGVSMTVADGIKQPGSFSKCYILLGINELGWGSSERFIECYRELVELIREAHPETEIYIIGNLPLGDKALSGGEWLTNDNVVRFNGYISQVAAEEEAYYIDAFSFLQVDGKLPDDMANDGVHVQPAVCQKLIEYLMSHTVG